MHAQVKSGQPGPNWGGLGWACQEKEMDGGKLASGPTPNLGGRLIGVEPAMVRGCGWWPSQPGPQMGGVIGGQELEGGAMGGWPVDSSPDQNRGADQRWSWLWGRGRRPIKVVEAHWGRVSQGKG